MATKQGALPPITTSIVDAKGVPTIAFAQFLSAQSANNIGPLPSAVDDAAAAKAGVPVNGLYQNSGSVRIRVS